MVKTDLIILRMFFHHFSAVLQLAREIALQRFQHLPPISNIKYLGHVGIGYDEMVKLT